MFNIMPKEYKKSVFEIDYELLKSKGIKNLLFDIDNTLAPFDIKLPTNEIIKLFEHLKAAGFKICLISNNKSKRAEIFGKASRVPAVGRAKKPSRRGIDKAMSIMGCDEKNCALIGDQLFTDVICANNNGLYAILVKPVSNRDEPFVAIKRYLEKPFLFIIERRFKL